MHKLIADPINEMQEVFNALCVKSDGPRGGPAPGLVRAMLREYGQRLNKDGYSQVEDALGWAPGADPWHVAFAVGLCWGNIAKYEKAFIQAAVLALADWNDEARNRGGRILSRKGLGSPGRQPARRTYPFQRPAASAELSRQPRWNGSCAAARFRSLEKLHPRYIGPWNALALFMTALFGRPELARSMRTARPLLPTGGPITAGLNLLHKAHVIPAPANTEHDNETFAALGAAAEDNGLMEALLEESPDWSMVDVHSGIYLLGTRDRRSRAWLQ